MRWYRYTIYKLYSWALKKKSNTPIGDVVLTMSFIHYIHLLIVVMLINKLLFKVNFFFNINKIYLFIFFILGLIIYYFLIYNKERWNKYIQEFNHETPQQSKRGKILVLTYLIGSILLFFLLLPILFRK